MCCDWLREIDAPIMTQRCEYIVVRVVTPLLDPGMGVSIVTFQSLAIIHGAWLKLGVINPTL